MKPEQRLEPQSIVATQVSQNPSSNDSFQALLPTKNIPALLSYYFGIFGLVPFLGLPFSIAAIVLAKIGLSRFKSDPTPGAKVHALIGLVLGIVQLIIFAAFIVFIILLSQN